MFEAEQKERGLLAPNKALAAEDKLRYKPVYGYQQLLHGARSFFEQICSLCVDVISVVAEFMVDATMRICAWRILSQTAHLLSRFR